ncbi:MAG: carboxypeptidase regulatory-like domain-containing protein [Planctomycetota bacterium]
MKNARFAPALAAAVLLLLAAACGAQRAGESATSFGPAEAAARIGAGPPPLVQGTVVEAATGKPLAGALVRAPGGQEVRTGADGRFVLAGLPAGTAGELAARTASGLAGRVRLRPLAPGTLEVVLFVR